MTIITDCEKDPHNSSPKSISLTKCHSMDNTMTPGDKPAEYTSPGHTRNSKEWCHSNN